MKKSIAFTFGRFQSISFGHLRLVRELMDFKYHLIFLSKTQDLKTNPLPWEVKLEWMEQCFPTANISCNDAIRTPYDAVVKLMLDGFDSITMICGSDRLETFKSMMERIPNPNNIELKVISSGERSEDEVTATKLREYVINDDIEAFKKGVPIINKYKEKYFNIVKKYIKHGHD